MANKKKLQHYVPQCYLRSWAANNKNQVYVYNKKLKKSYPANIHDVACENGFYDIDWPKLITPDLCEKHGIPPDVVQNLKDEQAIENYFAEHVEGEFSRILNTIINRVGEMNQWEIKNCWFISEEDKFALSSQLAMQYTRVKPVRSSMADTSSCMEQVLRDMEVSEEVIKKQTLSSEDLPITHAQLMFDSEGMEELAKCFFTLKWLLIINRTKQPFLTSDSPIGTRAHVDHPFLSMAGLRSKGIEAFFPITPNLLLLMYDGNYHTHVKNMDRGMQIVSNCSIVQNYNFRCIVGNSQYVISNTGDFSLIERIVEENPDALSPPHSVLYWGGKTYKPK